MLPHEIADYIENILIERGISKGDLYAACDGMSAAVMSNLCQSFFQ